MVPLEKLPRDLPSFLVPYEPTNQPTKPFITLTYAQSIDAKIAAKRGVRTTISHTETKTMTHYLRSMHDGILIGCGTAVADDPGLNCRFVERITYNEQGEPIVDETAMLSADEVRTPRPIILDPWMIWDYKGSKMEEICQCGSGKEPWVVVNEFVDLRENYKVDYLLKNGGDVIVMNTDLNGRISWSELFTVLKKRNIDSLMIEGGANVITQLLLEKKMVDSLIVTIGSTYLGQEGVGVSPFEKVNLRNISWWHGQQDSVFAANLLSS